MGEEGRVVEVHGGHAVELLKGQDCVNDLEKGRLRSFEANFEIRRMGPSRSR